MKTILCLASVLLFVVTSLHAQKPIVELPELQEWYSWNGAQSSFISYLPNFDTANDGINAVTQKRENNPTWYNRFTYDTTNKFSWASSWRVMPVDLNGDGMTDYVDAAGNVYQGLKKNSPPEQLVGTNYLGMGGGGFVQDFNMDGYEDILTTTEFHGTFSILLGGKDIKKLKHVTVNYPTSLSISMGVSAYMNQKNEPRLLLYNNGEKSEGFYLYSLSFEATPNDSIIVKLEELDRIKEIKQTIDQRFFDPSVNSFYQSKVKKNYSLFVFVTPLNEYHSYSIENDKFNLVTTKFIGGASDAALSGSIDGDNVEDYVLNNIFYVGTQKKRGYYLISGNPINDTTKRALFYLPENVFWGRPQYIGDVTGDGIGDLAYGQENGGLFIIYKGIDWRKLSVTNEIEKIDFTLHQTEPNPIGSEGRAVLPATLAHTGKYTLEVYNLTGKRLGELFSGDLPIGEVRLPFDVKMLHLSGGMYTLRLSDGKNTQERAFIYHP